eukprot:TRINITY_DN35905_c0_g1_i1.p1 TRINITY_DN35905_c0_g1~~TRINITY_DN35905_c0_g1_i1.p1  ORF type:complete len:277 (-),score=47.15 TRINITY_DN35905_c0_g1_i1:204-1034(-)
MQCLRSNVILQCRDSVVTTLRAAFIHSTSFSQAKWRSKFGFDAHSGKDLAKEYRRYLRRQHRSDLKKIFRAVDGVNTASKQQFQKCRSTWSAYRKRHTYKGYNVHSSVNSNESPFPKRNERQKSRKHRAFHAREQAKVQKKRRRRRKRYFYHESEDEDIDKEAFEEMLKHRWFHSSYSDWNEVRWASSQGAYWKWSTNYYSSDEGGYTIGSASDRLALGLSPRGPLTLEEVKQAFRMSALKWHPDRNEGPAKAMAEEKFKRCGAAYKSLCDAFSAD